MTDPRRDGPPGVRASRRRFLKTIGVAVGASALPRAAAPAPGPSQDRSGTYDVIVIGAGFAGVTAARELSQAGLRTLLLEARARIGGRTFTTRVGDDLFELGGTWVHSTQPHVFAEINRYGLDLVETNGGVPEQVLWWDGEQAREAGMSGLLPLLQEAVCGPPGQEIDAPVPTLQSLSLLSQLLEDYHADAAAAFPLPFDPFSSGVWRQADTLSVRDRLKQMNLPASRIGLLEGVLGASAHGPFDEASHAEMLRWWALSGNDTQRYSDSVARYRLRDGTISLLEAMLADCDAEVRLAAPVSSVVEREGAVGVTTTRGEGFQARAVIAALPMNVLSDIRFEPALAPEKLAAARERHAGSGVKVYIQLRDPIPSVALFAGESSPLSSIFDMQQAGGGGEKGGRELVAFGIDPTRIDIHDRAAVQSVLRRFLPEANVEGVLGYDWHLDPYSRGTWCVMRKGQMTRYLAALRQPHGRVRFAGGDFALGWRGFIDGAIESGNRVAHELIAELATRAPRAGHPAETTGSATAPAEVDFEGFRQCGFCHPVDQSGVAGVGPNLRGVFEREQGAADGFAYSEALGGRRGRWTEHELDAFLENPSAYAAGTTMPFGGVKDAAERRALVRYLRDLRER